MSGAIPLLPIEPVIVCYGLTFTFSTRIKAPFGNAHCVGPNNETWSSEALATMAMERAVWETSGCIWYLAHVCYCCLHHQGWWWRHTVALKRLHIDARLHDGMFKNTIYPLSATSKHSLITKWNWFDTADVRLRVNSTEKNVTIQRTRTSRTHCTESLN